MGVCQYVLINGTYLPGVFGTLWFL